ncbi:MULTISPECIES: helix-turn-helix domain-containing protein [Rhizobium]|uniref:HTH iclR-type domain-containing protein n=1 Tax=Rhizobium binae TaxID=1138190 RepID=A0ABV2MP62_9HYPH|nr:MULTISPECIES: helix-turn-helix domain-containing protein [Rhizobium]
MSKQDDHKGQQARRHQSKPGSPRTVGFELPFMTMSMNQILANPVEGETPSAHLKQIGLMTVIGCLTRDNPVITITRLTEITGLTRSAVAEMIGPLVERGLLVEEMGKNAMGRGMARQFLASLHADARAHHG